MSLLAIRSDYADDDRGFSLEILGTREEALTVRLLKIEDPPILLAEWRDKDVTSFVALRRLAAAAREAESWCADALEIPGPEWGHGGAPACVHFWIDRAWVTLKSSNGPDRMQLRFDVAVGDGLLRPYFIRCKASTLAEFGHRLSAHLDTILPPDE